jgi:hypothetical protein
MKGRPISLAAACLAGLMILASGAALAQSVVTYHNTPDRAGAYVVPGLTLAAAAKSHLDSHFHAAITGNTYAQPLYWQPSGAKTGLLIVATESNLVYALNADTGAQVWKTQLAAPIPGGETKGETDCGDITPEGVTGTPVIDPSAGVLYLDATTLQSGNVPLHEIYAVSLTNGKVLPHWPLPVDTALAALQVTFSSKIQGQRSALQFFKDKVYVTYAGRAGDCDKYNGTVIEVTPSRHAITGSWQTRALHGGIWAQGGVVTNGTSLFVTTGNTSRATSWSDGEAIIRLHPGLTHSLDTKDYFTPSNWLELDNLDHDLGGTAAIPFTVPLASGSSLQRLLALGKDGNAYLVDASNLGGIGGALEILAVSNASIVTAPAVYHQKSSTLLAFTNRNGVSEQCSGSNLTMLKVTAGGGKRMSVLWCAAFKGAGEPIITTTDGTADPIAWVTGAGIDNQLHGFDALTGAAVFSGAATPMTGLAHYSTILAANRHLYVAGSGTVYAFTF